MADISPTTGLAYYSGSWEEISMICKSLNIGDGLMSVVTQEVVNLYQEMVDREIDGELSDLYFTPFIPVNKFMPDGSLKSIYPGNIVSLARYWTAGLLLTSEFQAHEPNIQDVAQGYIEESKKQLYKIKKFSVRLEGQKFKSQMRTMPPTMQPPFITESDY